MRQLTDRERRRKRLKRRIQVVVIYTAIAIGLAWFFESQSTTTMIFVRHAEKAAEPADDPGLTAAGRRRVAELTRQLVDADVVAGVDAIYSTRTRRTKETVEPLANRLGLGIRYYETDPEDNEELVDGMVSDNKGRIILVVGHSDTIPGLIADVGASKNVPPIADDEYDNLYVVVIPWFGKTKTIRLRYGEPYRPDESAIDPSTAVSDRAESGESP
ncbi:MAG: histidine phosphatase family protein [Woeseiaceae bacterium]|nr:histidine phosphatase family protein [Woeseiaceae bacterium]